MRPVLFRRIAVVADAESDEVAVAAPAVHAEERLLRAVVVDLHAAVGAAGILRVVEVEVGVVAAQAEFARLRVVGGPELDVAGLEPRARLDAGDVRGDVGVVQLLLEPGAGGGEGDADLRQLLGEGVRRHPEVVDRAGGAGRTCLDEVGDAAEGVRAHALVDKEGCGVVDEPAPLGDVKRVDHLEARREAGAHLACDVRRQAAVDHGDLAPRHRVDVRRPVAHAHDGEGDGAVRQHVRGDVHHARVGGGAACRADGDGAAVDGEAGGQVVFRDRLGEGDGDLLAGEAVFGGDDGGRRAVGRIGQRVHLDAADVVGVAVVGERPVGGVGAEGAVADAELGFLRRGACGVVHGPVVEGENRLLRPHVVHLHAAVVSARHLVAEVVVGVAGPGDALVVVGAVGVGPELDEALSAVARLDAGDVAPHLQVLHVLLEGLAARADRYADERGVVGEGVHRHPDVLQVAAFLAQLHVVRDAPDAAELHVVVHGVDVRVDAVGADAFRVDAVDELVLPELRGGDVVLDALRVREHEVERLRGRRGVAGGVDESGDGERLCAVVGRGGQRERDRAAVAGGVQRGGGERAAGERVVREVGGGRLRDGRVQAQGDRGVRGFVDGGRDDGGGVRGREVLGVGVELLDRAAPGLGHQRVAGRVRVEAVAEVHRAEFVAARDGGVHVDDGDLLPLRHLRGHDIGEVGVVRLDARIARGVVAPHERGDEHVRGGLHREETVEERRRARHGVQRVGAGVVRADVEEDHVGRLDGGEPCGEHLEDAVAAGGAVDAPAAVSLVVAVHAVRRVGVRGVGAHIVHVVVVFGDELRPERPAVAAGRACARALGDRVAERHDAQHGVVRNGRREQTRDKKPKA